MLRQPPTTSSVGWYFGFKLHLIINDCGELLAVALTPGNTDDRKPVSELTKDLFGKLFGDRGYISQALFESLFERGLELITKRRKNMKNSLMPLLDKILLRKRPIIETVNDQLKNLCQIEHSRHRSPFNCLVNLVSGLIAYASTPISRRWASLMMSLRPCHRTLSSCRTQVENKLVYWNF